MASQSSFSAQVSAWVAETKGRAKAVRDESAQRVIEVMQTPVGAGGNLPVDTGFMRASLLATTGEVNFVARGRPDGGGRYAYDGGHVSLVIAGADLNDTITAVYTANYARHVEYGARGRPGRRFVALAAQQWARIVSEVAAEAQSRAVA